MNNRIKELRNALGLTQEKFGNGLGITKTSISKMELGKYDLTESMIKLICSEFNVSYEWLLTGKGEMLLTEDTLLLNKIVQKYNLLDIEVDIIRRYVSLPPATRQELIKFFSSIVNKPQEVELTIDDEIEAEIAKYRQELEEIKRKEALLASQKDKVNLKRMVFKNNLINFKPKD